MPAGFHGFFWGRDEAGNGRVRLPDGSLCHAQHTPPAFLPCANNPYIGKETFCISRDPYERAVSTYIWLQHWHDAEDLTHYDGINCTAEGLNGALQTYMRSYEHGLLGTQYCYIRPQSDFIWGPSGYKWCRHILRLEKLKTDFNDLMKASGYKDIELGAEHDNADRHCPNLSTDNLWPETRAMIQHVYAQDFKRLGYTPAGY